LIIAFSFSSSKDFLFHTYHILRGDVVINKSSSSFLFIIFTLSHSVTAPVLSMVCSCSGSFVQNNVMLFTTSFTQRQLSRD